MRILALDIETAPNLVAVYRLKQEYINPKYIMDSGYVLCFTAKWVGERMQRVFFAKSPDGHTLMLKTIHTLLKQADAVLHFNGKRFDMPTLNAEFLLHGLEPIPGIVQIDLLPLIRRAFNFPSSKLDYICQRLGIGGKARNGGWEMWKACMDNLHASHAKAWKVMERYNKHDVVLLERLYRRLRPWFTQTHGFKRIGEWLDGKRSKP